MEFSSNDPAAALKEAGYKVSTIDVTRDLPALLKAIKAQKPDVLFNGQGRVAAIAREKGIAPKDLVQDSEDEEYLSARVREMKVFE